MMKSYMKLAYTLLIPFGSLLVRPAILQITIWKLTLNIQGRGRDKIWLKSNQAIYR